MAGRIREADIAVVRERNRVDEVVGEYVTLRRAGGGALKGLCPFHEEKTPSFNVRPSYGTFHCFGCGEGGDVIAFVMKIEHLGFVEAVERLAAHSGVELTYEGGRPGAARDRGTRSRMLDAHRAAAEFYAEQLTTPEAAKAREYLTERGFDEATAQLFGCGYAPAGWDQLTKHLLGRGFDLDELYKAQLSREGRQGRPMDKFHRRLLWPLKDLGGDVVGFGARRLYDDDQIAAKYLNTSDSPIFKKSQVLFGVDRAKREIAKRHQAVVVEGYTDVMAMHVAGVPTAVAACGTAFGDDHMAVLRRLMLDDDAFRGEVIFTFDGDEAGRKAALKAFEGDQQFAAQTYVAIAPDAMDPCELWQAKGDVAVRDLVARRTPLFEFAIRSLLNDYDLEAVDGQVTALQRTVPLVSSIKDRASRDGYATKLAWWVGWTDESMVVRRVRESAGEAPTGRRPRRVQPVDPNQAALEVNSGPPRPDPRDQRLHAQRDVLKAALQLPALAGPVYDALPDEAFTHPAYLSLHRAIQAAGGTASGLNGPELAQAVAKRCTDGTTRTLVSELAVESMPTKEESDTRYVEGILAGLQKELVGRQIASMKSRLQRLNPLTDADEYRSVFGDLVAFEEYHRALVRQASGMFE
ncbi:MAG TPA: DNA primase [Pseudonocardiaceae bacterium]|nr:DNA primase [Pseudonocardiaceae bacterium]